MRRTHTVVIGGGQAGLAMSRCLSDRGIDHVVFERGRVAERWRSERWDSLRLLTPRWQARLPSWRYRGDDPDGFMSMPEVIAYLSGYARSLAVPVEEHTSVRRVEPAAGGWRVATDRGDFCAATVVVATGACSEARIPAQAADLAPSIHQVVPTRYRRPSDLPDGGVLVVGASASGVQLADELRRAGRRVILAVGRHTRLPRRHRGADIMWWLDRMGVLDRRAADVRDLEAARREPSLQLVGREDGAALDLGALMARGVRLTGRMVGMDGARVGMAEDLAATMSAADDGLFRLLARIDAFATREGLAAEHPLSPPVRLRAPTAPTVLDLRAEGVTTVLWATGFRRRYPFLSAPVLDERGDLWHHDGVTSAPGLYVLGLPFLRRRKSTYLDGVGDDAAALAAHIAKRANHRTPIAA